MENHENKYGVFVIISIIYSLFFLFFVAKLFSHLRIFPKRYYGLCESHYIYSDLHALSALGPDRKFGRVGVHRYERLRRIVYGSRSPTVQNLLLDSFFQVGRYLRQNCR